MKQMEELQIVPHSLNIAKKNKERELKEYITARKNSLKKQRAASRE